MQTRYLIDKIVEAKKIRIASWEKCDPNSFLTCRQAVDKAFKNFSFLPPANQLEMDLAYFLLDNAWNEIEDWQRSVSHNHLL